MSEGHAAVNPINVAYAEDHITVRETISFFLESQGEIKIIIKAANGLSLIQQIEQSKTKPDVCVIDIKMPKMDGFETVSAIKHRWPEMKILALSGYQREEFIIKLILAGVHGYLSQSDHPREISNAIKEVHRNDYYYGEHFSPKLLAAVRSHEKSMPELTEMETQLLRLSLEDLTYAEIAKIMQTTPKSVEGYRSKLFQKLGVKSKVGLAKYAVRFGYVSIEPQEVHH